MMKKIYFSVFILILCISVLASDFTQADFLKTNGRVLKNNKGNGSVVNLHGTNLGSWLSMEDWIGPLGSGALDRNGWIATASVASFNGTIINNVFDGDLSTRWCNGVLQSPITTQWFKLDMGESKVFDKIIIDAGDFTGDFIHGYSIKVSDDNTNWTTVSTANATSQKIEINFGAVKARYIQIFQTGTASNNFWSIAEINVFMNDHFSVNNTLNNRFGVANADLLWNYYQNLWITTDDLDSIKNMNLNMVRVPFFWMEVMNNDGSMKENAFTQLDWIVNECSTRGIYVILDLHGAPGGLDGYITSGQAVLNNLWTDNNCQTMTINLWKAVASHYNGNPTVAAYDLLNEPVSTNANVPIKTFYNTLYKAVRDVDPDHIISMQAFYGFNFLDSPSLNGWVNVLYQAHYYNTNTTDWNSQDGFINWALSDMAIHQQTWNVPVLAGEYNFWGFLDLWKKWMDGLISFDASWSNWCYKNKTAENNWGFYLANTNPIPDMSFDDIPTIEAKWDKFKTSFFTRNDSLIQTVKEAASTLIKPLLNKTIWLKAFNDNYLSSENGLIPLTCNKPIKGGNELFTIKDAGDGKIAFIGNNGKYITSGNGTVPMTCNSTGITEQEKFILVNIGNNKVAIIGNSGFVSMEGGIVPVTCNRQTFQGWEIFTLGIESSISATKEFKDIDINLYPNPITGHLLNIQGVSDKYTLSIFNLNGLLLLKQRMEGKEGSNQIDVSSFSTGFYIVEIKTIEGLFIADKQIIVQNIEN